MFTPRLTAREVLSIVLAAPSGSAVRYSLDEGYTISDHLLATLSEQQAGLVRLPGRHVRPGVQVAKQPASTQIGGFTADVLSLAEFEARRAQVIQKRKVM